MTTQLDTAAPEDSLAPPAEPVAASSTDRAQSRQQPFWHVIVLAVFIPLSLYLPYWYYKTVKTLRGHAIQLSEKNTAMPATLAAYQRTNPAVALLLLLSPTILGFVLFVALGPAHYSWLRMIGPAIPVLTLLFFAALFRDIVLISSPGV